MDMPSVTVGTVIGVAATAAIAWIKRPRPHLRPLAARLTRSPIFDQTPTLL